MSAPTAIERLERTWNLAVDVQERLNAGALEDASSAIADAQELVTHIEVTTTTQ